MNIRLPRRGFTLVELLVVLVDPRPDGMVDCEAIAKEASYTFGLMNGKGEWIFEQPNFTKGKKWVAEGVVNTSYGMNNRAHVLRQDERKVLMVEYERLVADVVGASADSAKWPELSAPRHFSYMNVLYNDGSVKSVKAERVDPRVTEIHNDFWRPNRDPAL